MLTKQRKRARSENVEEKKKPNKLTRKRDSLARNSSSMIAWDVSVSPRHKLKQDEPKPRKGELIWQKDAQELKLNAPKPLPKNCAHLVLTPNSYELVGIETNPSRPSS
jgi:hypothetical protein